MNKNNKDRIIQYLKSQKEKGVVQTDLFSISQKLNISAVEVEDIINEIPKIKIIK